MHGLYFFIFIHMQIYFFPRINKAFIHSFTVTNCNIGRKHLASKWLHLNPYETARLALNLKVTMRKLWSKFGNLWNPGYHSNVTSVSSDRKNFQKLNRCNKTQPGKSTFSFQETNQKSCKNSNISIATMTLRNLRLENPNRIIIGQLNINPIRNKFETLTSLITNEINVLLLSEAKSDEMFPLN